MKKIIIIPSLIAVFHFFFIMQLHAQINNKKIDSLRTLLSNTTNSVERFRLLVEISETISFNAGDPDPVLVVNLLKIAREQRNDSLLAISYDFIGQVSRIKGDNTTGLEYLFKAIPLAEKTHDKRRLSSIYFDIASLYINLQNIEEYGKYIRKGGENLPDKSHPRYNYMVAQYQRGMLTYYVLNHLPDSAIVYTQPFMNTSRLINSPLYLFNACYLTAAMYNEFGEKDIASLYFKKAQSAAVNSSYSQLRFAGFYIPFLLNNKRFAEAKEQAMQLLNESFANENNDYKLAGAGFLQQVYDSLHQTDSAYYYARKEIEFNRLIFNQNNNNKIQALAFNEQVRQIDEQAKEKQAEEERRQNIQYALIALGIIIFITLFLLLSRTVIVNERLISFFAILGLLVVFEFINLLIHPWLAHFTYESPVLMLLALVIIASLLIPLHHKLEHWIKEKMIEKNKAIRLAAAKKTIEKLGDNKNNKSA